MFSDRISRRGYMPEKVPLSLPDTHGLQGQYALAVQNVDRLEDEIRDINGRIHASRAARDYSRLAALVSKRELLIKQVDRAKQECANAKAAIKSVASESSARAFMTAAMRTLTKDQVSAIWDEVWRVRREGDLSQGSA